MGETARLPRMFSVRGSKVSFATESRRRSPGKSKSPRSKPPASRQNPNLKPLRSLRRNWSRRKIFPTLITIPARPYWFGKPCREPPDTALKQIINTVASGRARTVAWPTPLRSQRHPTYSTLSARSRGVGACGPSMPGGGKERRASGANSFFRDNFMKKSLY